MSEPNLHEGDKYTKLQRIMPKSDKPFKEPPIFTCLIYTFIYTYFKASITMSKESFWKIWLRPNHLSRDVENDYIAEVSTKGNTARNEQLAQIIVKERSELRYDTILAVLNERDAAVRELLLEGSSVQDGNVHLAPRISGRWIGSDPVFDPKKHKITAIVTLTRDLRRELNQEVGVEILGRKACGGALIGLVTDVATGATNGVISPGGDLIIQGEKMKIAPWDEAGLGVFFVASNGEDIPLDYPLTQNTPKRIVCRVPAFVKNGLFTLKIVTRYSNGTILLKDPRPIVYELPLKAGNR
jgi:hypothetical protein